MYVTELAVLLVIVRVRLTRHGFQRAVAWSTTVREARTDDERAALRTVQRAKASAELVFRWHPVPNKCLEQSLVTAKFLARRGIKAEVVVAVRKYPFESHAWTRWGELDLTDPPESHPEDFRVLTRF